MKRFVKIMLVTIVVLVLGAFAGVWWLNRWLKSPATHAQVERELSKLIKLPLKFKSLNLSLWGGLRAEGITVPDGDGNFLEVPAFTAKHRLLPMFQGRLILEDVTIENAKFSIVQNPDGSFRTPKLPADLAAEKKNDAKPKAPKPASTPKPKSEGMVVVEKITLKNGTANLFTSDGQPFVSASGLRFVVKDVRDEKLNGHVVVARIVLHGFGAFTDFNAGVHNSDEKGFIVERIAAKCGGGTIAGGFAMKKGKPEPSYTGKAAVVNVDITQAAAEGDLPVPNLTGVLDMSFNVKGTGGDTKTMSGKGLVTLRDGTCREVELLRDIGEVLQMEGIAQFGIPEARAEMQIWNGRLNVKPLVISAPPLSLSATGILRLDGKMDLDAVLGATVDFIAKRPSIEGQFSAADAAGMRGLPFRVHGTMAKPKNDLMEKLAGSKDKRAQKRIAIEAAIESAFGPPPPPKKPEPPKP